MISPGVRLALFVALGLSLAASAPARAQWFWSSSNPAPAAQPAPATPPAPASAPTAAAVANDPSVPRPPGLVPNVPETPATAALPPPPPPPAAAMPAAPRAPAAAAHEPAQNPVVPPSLGGIAAMARFGRDANPITSGLVWRVYADRPDQNGVFRVIKEEKSATPNFVLPPGSYILHVAFGMANAAKKVQVRADTTREIIDIPAGGVRFEGRVGDTRIQTAQISFDVFKGSQLDGGEKKPIVSDVKSGEVVLLPEGAYHVLSNYGDGNAVMRYDIRVAAGKLTDTRINHRAAVITLKLVSEKGGEAIANTAWSVLTPGGDVIKESIGAFPRVVLSEGGYVALARNEGKVYNREFKVETGVDREIELLAR